MGRLRLRGNFQRLQQTCSVSKQLAANIFLTDSLLLPNTNAAHLSRPSLLCTRNNACHSSLASKPLYLSSIPPYSSLRPDRPDGPDRTLNLPGQSLPSPVRPLSDPCFLHPFPPVACPPPCSTPPRLAGDAILPLFGAGGVLEGRVQGEVRARTAMEPSLRVPLLQENHLRLVELGWTQTDPWTQRTPERGCWDDWRSLGLNGQHHVPSSCRPRASSRVM